MRYRRVYHLHHDPVIQAFVVFCAGAACGVLATIASHESPSLSLPTREREEA